MAHQLWIYEGNSVWSKFNTMLVVNSITFAVAAELHKPVIWVCVGIVGIIVCIAWYSWIERGFNTIKYWVNTAKELENTHLGPQVKNTQRGGDFAEGRSVTFEIAGKQEKMEINGLFSRWRIEKSSKLAIKLFIFIYFIAAVVNGYSLCCPCAF